MNFYDPHTYTNATTISLMSLAADDKVGMMERVYVYDNGEIEISSENITADDLELGLFAFDDEVIDGTHYGDDTFISFTLAKHLRKDDATLRKAIIQGFKVNDLGIRIGKFQICQLEVITFSLSGIYDVGPLDWSCHYNCESRSVRKKGVYLYDGESDLSRHFL